MSGGAIAGVFFGVLFIALLIEGLTEWIFGTKVKGKPIKILALCVGVTLACLLQLDVIRPLFGDSLDIGDKAGALWACRVLTGLIAGMGSNQVHKLLGKYLPES